MGVGVFGRNHARVYKELELQGEAVRLLGVVDPDTSRADAVAREFECKAFGSVQQLLTTHSEVQAASVATPTLHHLSVARELMKNGVDVLVEKPIAATLDEADELVDLARQHKLSPKSDISSVSTRRFAPPFPSSPSQCSSKCTA